MRGGDPGSTASSRIVTGGELVPIAHELALFGERDDIEQWVA